MSASSRILPIRPLVLEPARLGGQRHFSSGALIRARFTLRHLALADASRPAWLNAPLFSRYQPPSALSALARHAA